MVKYGLTPSRELPLILISKILLENLKITEDSQHFYKELLIVHPTTIDISIYCP